MNDRIKNKLYKAYIKYNTDCLIGKIRTVDCEERTVIFVKTYDSEYSRDGLSIIGLTGINLFYLDKILYVRDLQDIAATPFFQNL